jgi:phosphinothricin acetyltransferase
MVAIRAARAEDAATIAAIYAPYVLGGTVSFETDAPDTRTMARRMAASGGLYPWIVATNGEDADKDGRGILAYAYATQFRDRPAYKYVVETSVYVAGAVQGRRIGRLVYEALIDTLRAQGFTQAIGVLSLPHDQSIKTHEAVGFRRAGVYRDIGFKLGRWMDVGFWQCALNDSRVPPADPRPFSDVGVVRG